MTRSIWKGPFINYSLLKKVQKNRNQIFKIWSRNSTILPQYIGLLFDIYNGNSFIRITVTENMIGHKFGEFANTRKFTVHKKKK